MKLSEWLKACDEDEDLPDFITVTRPLEVVVLAKVWEEETNDVSILSWRTVKLPFWEALGMIENYRHLLLIERPVEIDDGE